MPTTQALEPTGSHKAGEPQLVSYLSARWTLPSTASWQDVPGQKSDDDDCRRDRDDGDGGGGYDHAAILASLARVETGVSGKGPKRMSPSTCLCTPMRAGLAFSSLNRQDR